MPRGIIKTNTWGEGYRRLPRVEDARPVTVIEVAAVLRWGTIRPEPSGDYRVPWQDVKGERITLTLRAKSMPKGGVRRFLLCPLCGEKRTALYYPPPGLPQPSIACRVCNGFVYRSAQEAHRIEREAWQLVRLLRGEVTLAQARMFVQSALNAACK